MGSNDPQNPDIDLNPEHTTEAEKRHNEGLREEADGMHTGLDDQPTNEGGVPVPPRDKSIDDKVRAELDKED